MPPKRPRTASPVDADNADAYHVVLPSFVTDEQARRIRRFLDYTATDLSVYYISQLPSSHAWGTTRPASLCTAHEGLPIRIWIVGVVTRLQASASSDEPRRKFTINLSYIREVDRQSTQSLLALSKPRPWPGQDEHTFEASQSTIREDVPELFGSVFDATVHYASREDMRALSIADLVVGDVVLAETFCYRWHRPWMRASAGWNTWYTSFRLDSVSLLVRAPRTVGAPAPPSFVGCL